MKEFFKGIKSDWKKIVWSDRKTLVKETVAVIGFCVVICILIMGVDTLTQYGVNFVTGLIK
ncbi:MULTISPECIES: preprotein translocase subunit SecE [unclassified Ruminococcus]|jgi:preprotein translocase subunit SecE|uniref:preprotein translocase subunit SecE n=1 Tax=unclassified Ruminococcus TaxID=2608920 RepID=UPI00319E112F